jgi:16S rRNA processing protein RimM
MARQPPADLVCVALIAAAHGVRGALKLRCFTEQPESVAAYGPLFDETGRELFPIRVIGTAKEGVIASAEGIEDRNAAEALRGVRLYVPRDRLPPAEEDEFYYHDLVGARVLGPAGQEFGAVSAIYDFGAGDVLEVTDAGGEAHMLPFTREVVPEIDLAARRIVVSLDQLEGEPGESAA